jgi:cobalt-zinc-cadmium efflux system protein
VAVLISALLVGATGWLWLDPLTAIGVGVAVLLSAWGLLREALALNLDAVPLGIDLAQVEGVLRALPGVIAVEELHVWGLSTSRAALTAHLQVRPHPMGEGVGALLALARERLAAIGIRNTTLQLEQLSEPFELGSSENPMAREIEREQRP